MGIINKLFTFVGGTTKTGEASQINADFDSLYTLVNGNIDDANISATANIQQSKILSLITDLQARVAKTGDTMTGEFQIATGQPRIRFRSSTSGVYQWLMTMDPGGLDFYRNDGTDSVPIWVLISRIDQGATPLANTSVANKLYVDGQISSLQSEIDSINAALLTPIIGTGQLKTATGTASSSSGADVTMNDYSFFPAFTDTTTGWGLYTFIGVPDPGDTIARVTISGGPGGTWTTRWRYMTATDNPTIWTAVDNVTGVIKGAWTADDPAGDAPGIVIHGCTSRKFVSSDLDLQPTAEEIAKAMAGIASQKYSTAHIHYRALQARTNNPAQWIARNARIDNDKLVLK